jgi:hypothetical protein
MRGAHEPYKYEREVEDFLRWSPHVRNPSFRKESRLSPGEMIELQRLLSDYGDRVGAPKGAGSRLQQSQSVTRAAGAGAGPRGFGESEVEPPRPVAGEPGVEPPRPVAGESAVEPPRPVADEPGAEPLQPVAGAPGAEPLQPVADEPEAPEPAGAREAEPRAEAPPLEPQPEPPPVETVPPDEPPDESPPVGHYDDLEVDEILSLLDSLEEADLAALLAHERRHGSRARIVLAIEGLLARRAAGQPR